MKPWILALAILAACRAFAPGQQAKSPRFDVVSIKPNNSGRDGASWDSRLWLGRWTARNLDVGTAITAAFGLSASQVIGIPDWARKPGHRYDIVATAPAGTSDADFHQMLQAMLMDRFGFAGHRETRQIAVRTLELAKSGPKLTPASGHCIENPIRDLDPSAGEYRCGQFYFSSTWPADMNSPGAVHTAKYEARSASIADFVSYFGRMGRIDQPPLVDLTGLADKYDMSFTFDLLINPVDADGKPVDESYKILDAMEKQLGLKMNTTQLKKLAMPVLVIDKVEPATAN